MIHLIGAPVHVDSQLRQRCAWCGAAVIDQDLARTMVLEDSGPEKKKLGKPRDAETYPTWEPGSFVYHSGGLSYTVWSAEEGQDKRLGDLPDVSCLTVDPGVTV